MVEMLAVCGILILLDILAGVVAAAKNRELDSSIMREGLYHKSAELMLLGVSEVAYHSLQIYPFTESGVPPEVASSVCLYVAAMELVSILENVCKINPELKLGQVLGMFGISQDSKEFENQNK